MKFTHTKVITFTLLSVLSCARLNPETDPMMVAIEQAKGNHLVHFSNRTGSFWSGETRAYTNHWSTGFYRYRERLFGELVLLKLSGAEDRYRVRKEGGKWTLRRNDQPFEAEAATLHYRDPASQTKAARWPLWEAVDFPVDQRIYKSQHKP